MNAGGEQDVAVERLVAVGGAERWPEAAYGLTVVVRGQNSGGSQIGVILRCEQIFGCPRVPLDANAHARRLNVEARGTGSNGCSVSLLAAASADGA